MIQLDDKAVIVDGDALLSVAEAAARGGLKAAGDIFLVFETGFAQVHVGVGESGHEQQPGGVHDGAAVGRVMMSGGRHGDDAPVTDEQVHGGVEVAGVFQTERHAERPPSLRVASR